MPKIKYCPNCNSQNEDDSTFCAQCGASLITDETATPAAPPSKYAGIPRGGEKQAMDHLRIGYNVAMEQPMVFLPPLISGVLGYLVSFTLTNISVGVLLFTLIGSTSSIFSFILNFASTDMSRDAYYKQPLDLGQSIKYVVGRFFTFLLAAIFGGLLSITVVLIPVVLFMFVIMVLDETGIMESFEKAISVLRAELRDVLVLFVVSIVASLVIGYLPLFSSLLNSIVNVIIGIAFIDIYVTHKNR